MLRRKVANRFTKERVGAILLRSTSVIVKDWLARAKQSSELNRVALSDEERTGHLPKLVEDLALRLSKTSAATKDSDSVSSDAAIAHGKLRYQQGYTPAMLVHESRILQVTIFGTLHNNIDSLDHRLQLPDVIGNRGRSRFAVDTVHGQLHEVMRKSGGSVAPDTRLPSIGQQQPQSFPRRTSRPSQTIREREWPKPQAVLPT